MTSPVADIVALISDNIEKFEPFGLKADHVYAYMIDREDYSKEDAIIVVSELPAKGSAYGNGIPIYDKRRIQLTFYYPRDFEYDQERLESELRSFLLSYGYQQYQNAGHVLTPDTQNITNTLKFNFIKETQ